MEKNETNPVILAATGYAPYVKARAERKDGSARELEAANRRAQEVCAFWKRQHNVDDLKEFCRRHESDLFRNRWEFDADKKTLYSRVRWEMDKITAEMERDLEQRRTRLADQLRAEEDTYLDEMTTGKEDPCEKQDRMLQRYATLKARKECERVKMAQEKREQQFKRNCEELRALVSRKIQCETAEEGRRIAWERGREAEEKSREDALYAELWCMDRKAKDLKEAQETEEKRRRSMENGRFVRDQILKNQLGRQKQLREKEHDAAIMEEKKRLAALEEEYEKELKKRKQVELKTGLDECTREKLKRRAKEVQEDLLKDLFFMKQIAESEEEAAKCEKKRALLLDQKLYLQHLENQIKAEAEFEKEVDRMYQEEVERTWKKREEEWEREKKHRRQKEQDVVEEVKAQIQSNLEKSQELQEMSKFYSQQILDRDAEDRRKDAEKLRLIREKNIGNQAELLDQIRRKEDKQMAAKMKLDMELELQRREREELECKIQQLMSDVKIDNEHPFRVLARDLCCTPE